MPDPTDTAPAPGTTPAQGAPAAQGTNGLRARVAELERALAERDAANALLEQGVRASVYEWPRGTPLKADIGYLLMENAHA